MTEQTITDEFIIIKEDGLVFEKHKEGLTVNIFTQDDYLGPRNEANTAFTCNTMSDKKLSTMKSFIKRWFKENPE